MLTMFQVDYYLANFGTRFSLAVAFCVLLMMRLLSFNLPVEVRDHGKTR